MIKEAKSGSGQLSGNGIIAVVLLATGALFVRDIPLETNRLPAGEQRMEQQFSLQNVDARLWQDPFSAIAKGRAEAKKRRPEKAAADDRKRTAAQLAGQIEQRKLRKQSVEILAVMLAGGPYADNVESRRRARYAVMAGLNANRLVPVDNEHLGYFFPADPGDLEARLPETVPYEWFEPAPDVRLRDAEDRRPTVLVMWLQSEAFAEKPLQGLKELATPFRETGAHWRVLGPYGSDGLKAMIDETTEPGFPSDLLSGLQVRFYSHYATVSDRVLLAKRPDNEKYLSLTDFFDRKGVTLVRTLADDGLLADSLIKELELRGLNASRLETTRGSDETAAYWNACRAQGERKAASPSHIAVVAEWDSLYGRSVRREFRATAAEAGFCVDQFSYVRGLDGQLPVSGGDAASGSGGGGKQAQDDKDAARRKDGTFVERAEGQSQFDYLRRLAVQMRVLDRQLRKTSADGAGLRAIGVLGNDVHDKLLVLQALQPEFPHAIFFTTDLDARFLHPREQAWTRNLVVASNFGLRLGPALQGGAPPFRDSYQTSAFLSTRLAIDDARRAVRSSKHDEAAGSAALPQAEIAKWFKTPRIFEIGRTGAFDFSPGTAGKVPRAGQPDVCRGRDWVACPDIHPPGSPRYPTPPKAMLLLIASLGVLALWLPALLVHDAGKAMLAGFLQHAASPARRVARYAALALLLVLLQVALPLALAALWEPFADGLTRGGKPLVAFEGISLWPTEAIRLCTLLLCIYLVLRSWITLTRNLEQIRTRFCFEQTCDDLLAQQRKLEAALPWPRRLARLFCIGTPATALSFWERHAVQNRPVARFARTTVYVILMLGLSYLLVQALGDDRFVPQRGELSRAVHEWLRIPALVAMYFLVAFVVDATLFCVGFLRGLRQRADNWPPSTLKVFRDQLGIPAAQLDDWIDLQFIALRTHSVTRLIYYPFIVLSLLLLSRSSAFDDWSMPASTIVLAAAGAAVAVGCALALRLTAEASRRHALEHVDNALMRAEARPEADAGAAVEEQASVKQLGLLRARIESLSQGAFAPFWQQPLLKAVLLPFATLGGTTLLDYMALANL